MTKLLNEFLVGLRPMGSFLKEEPESGFNAPFGKYAFDDKRKDVPQDQKEPPTPEEDKVDAALGSYIAGNEKQQLDAVAPMLVSLVKQKKYQAILDPSGTQFVYRIMQVPEALASKLLGTQVNDQTPSGLAGAGVLNPSKAKVSGWTSDANLVLKFEPMGDAEGTTLLLFRAPVKGNTFFGKPGELASVVSPDHKFEMETIAVGPVKYDKAAFVVTTNEENPAQKLFDLMQGKAQPAAPNATPAQGQPQGQPVNEFLAPKK